jgi:hypothetical protein
MSTPSEVSSPQTAFVALSSVLVGLDSSLLDPPLDPQNLAGTYFSYASQRITPLVWDQLFSTFLGIQGQYPPAQWPAAVNSRILQNPLLGPVGRQIIKMWMLGIWFDPPEQSLSGEVISSTAFTRGLLWTVIRAHPTGYSQFSHGYWHTPPPPGPVNP